MNAQKITLQNAIVAAGSPAGYVVSECSDGRDTYVALAITYGPEATDDQIMEDAVADRIIAAAGMTIKGGHIDPLADGGCVHSIMLEVQPQQYHVYAIECGDGWMGECIALDALAASEDEAVALCEAAGYTVVREDAGGCYDTKDSEDGPGFYGYEPDGLGAICITIEPL